MSAAEKDINTALSSRLALIQVAGSPPIAWENTIYSPTAGTIYLRENFLPNMKDPVGISHASTDDYEGIYQVTVIADRGTRRFDAQEQARLVALHFPRGGEYTYNGVMTKITKTVINSPLIIDNQFAIPISIYWRAFA